METFTGVFATFDEIARKFPRSLVSYNSAESERETIARFSDSLVALADARSGIAPESAERFMFLCALVALLPDPTPTILDVGGGTGGTLAHLVYSCPGRECRLIVYDLPPIVDAGREAFRDIDNVDISFVDSLTKVDRRIDIVFASSFLQYIEDYRSFLAQIVALRPRMIVIAYTPMTDAPTFITAQVNIRGRIIPNKIINHTELVAQMASMGFTLIYRSVARTAAHFRNFPAPQSKSASINLVFRARA